jgi:hypothetical protein
VAPSVSVAGHRGGAGGRPGGGGLGSPPPSSVFGVGGAIGGASCSADGHGSPLVGGVAKAAPFCACPMELGSTAGPGEILAFC